MAKVVHFEINADNPEGAIKFYGEVFGWKFTQWEENSDYWVIKAGKEDEEGIDGGLNRRKDPQASTYCIISVKSVDETLEKIEKRGGTVVAPKMSIPGVGYAAYFRDTEGNVLGIIEEDPSAR